MARKTTTKKPARKKPAVKPKVEDAQVVSETPAKSGGGKPQAAKSAPAAKPAPTSVTKDAAAKAPEPVAKTSAAAPEMPSSPKPQNEKPALTAEAKAAAAPKTETPQPKAAQAKPASTASTPPPAKEPQVIVKKAGAVPMILGGLVAGGIGFGAAWYMGQQDKSDDSAALDALRAELAATQEAVTATQAQLTEQLEQTAAQIAEGDAKVAQSVADLVIPADPAEALADLGSQISATDGRIETALAASTELAARVTAVEKRPLAENAAEEAVAAYDRELAELRARLEAQATELDAIAAEAATSVQTIRDQAMSEIEATRAKAEDLAAQAEADERQAAANAALGEIAAAAQSGAPFAVALAAFAEATGTTAPEALSAVAESGIATPQDLQAAYPPLAREALAASRSDQGTEGGIGGFLSAQLGVRSLAPQEGDSPNAVLSRVEAAVTSGDLGAALTEIEALPDTARGILSPWVETVSTRNNALAEVETLQRSLAAE